jgi:hypothetical protein
VRHHKRRGGGEQSEKNSRTRGRRAECVKCEVVREARHLARLKPCYTHFKPPSLRVLSLSATSRVEKQTSLVSPLSYTPYKVHGMNECNAWKKRTSEKQCNNLSRRTESIDTVLSHPPSTPTECSRSRSPTPLYSATSSAPSYKRGRTVVSCHQSSPRGLCVASIQRPLALSTHNPTRPVLSSQDGDVR